MRKKDTEKTEQAINLFYENLSRIVELRGIKWKDLAAMIDVGPGTMASMKSQNQNPSLTTVKKIAEALDVTVEELTEPWSKSQDYLNEVIWLLRRVSQEEGFEADRLAFVLLNIIGPLTGHDNEFHPDIRNSICAAEMVGKLKKLYTDLPDQD